MNILKSIKLPSKVIISISFVIVISVALMFTSPIGGVATPNMNDSLYENSYQYGGGGVGPPPLPPGVTDVSGYVNYEGVFIGDVTIDSEDNNVILAIEAGTTGLTDEGDRLSQISIIDMEDPPDPPVNSNVIGLTYDLGPDGATFDPPVTITFSYDESLVPEGVTEGNLRIAIWVDGEWLELDGIVDTENNTITAEVSHFTAFNVIAYTKPAAFGMSNLTISSDSVIVGKSVVIGIQVENTGDLVGNHRLTLYINDVSVDTKEITVPGNTTRKVFFSTTQDTPGTYTVGINGLSDEFTVSVPVEPEPPEPTISFSTTALDISPTTADVDGNVIISVLVSNTGDTSGSTEVVFEINDVAVASRIVTLPAGASEKISVTTSQSNAGTYKVTVDELSDQFTVSSTIPPSSTVNWLIIAAILAGIIGLGVITWMVILRNRLGTA